MRPGILGCAAIGVALTPVTLSAQTPPPVSSNAPNTTDVAAVVVAAKRPEEQVLLDRKVYTVSSDLRSASATAADILNQVPSVDIDADGNLTLRGDANVTILVDGKPSAQFSGATRGLSLQQFSAQDIDRIEVMTNPPARFKAEGSGGVINIITKKTRRPGLAGTATLSLGDKRRFATAVNASYNVGRLKLSGGVSLRQDARQRVVNTDLTAPDPNSGSTIASQEVLQEHLRRLIPQMKLAVDYDLGDRSTVGVSLSHRELSGNRYFTQSDQSTMVGGPLINQSVRYSNGHEWSVDNAEVVHFDQKLWRPDETLSLSLQRSVTRERERYTYDNINLFPVAPPSQDDLRLSLDLVTIEFSADYELPISDHRDLKFGFDLEDQNNRFDNTGNTIDPTSGLPVNNPRITNHFRYWQDVYAVYGEYKTVIGKWTLQSGLRLERTSENNILIFGALASQRNYFRAYPSLNLEYPSSNGAKFSFSVSRRITRPDPELLNPFVDYQDTHNLRAGNSRLLPQDTWSYELGYTSSIAGVNYGLTGYYQFNRDSVTDVTSLISADVVLVTKANLPKSQSAGLEFSADGKIGRKLSYNLSGNLFYGQIDATALGAFGLQSTEGVNLKANLEYKPTSRDTAQISFSRTDRRLTPQGFVDAINVVNFGYRHQLRPNLAAVITVSDALNGQRFRRTTSVPTLVDDYTRYQVGRIAYIGFTYTFGLLKKPKSSNFDYEQ